MGGFSEFGSGTEAALLTVDFEFHQKKQHLYLFSALKPKSVAP